MAGKSPSASARRRRRRIAWTVVLGAVVLLVGGVYLAGYLATGDRTPANATVHGIAIGGLSRADAEQKLRDELAPDADRDLQLRIDGETTGVAPADLGLGVDIPASVDASGVGRSADPMQIWRVLTGGQEQAPVITVDETALTTAVAGLAADVDRDPVDAGVAFADGTVKVTEARTSKTLQQAEAVAAIRESYLTGADVEIPVVTAEPEITDAEAAEAVTFAKAAASGPIPMTVTNTTITYQIPVATVLAAYSFEVTDGELAPKLDTEKLYQANAEGIAALPVTKPRNARIEIRGGSPTVVPSVDGTSVTKEAFLKAVPAAIGKTGEARVAKVDATVAKPSYTTADAQKAGVKQVVASFTTPFPYAEYRNTNLSVAASLMNNTYLEPNGGQFSLNGEIGPRSPSQGFIDGYFIENGILKKGLAGGISQSATTVYNAAFFAGLKIDQHQPHTLYFSRYPAGRESTVYYPSIDVKFTNDTPHGVVVEAFVDKASPGGTGSITVRIWSTKYYNVESAEPRKSGFYSGTTRYVDDPNCEYQAPIQGFTATYARTVRKLDGSVHRQENYSWKYSAGDEIRCGKPPKNDDEDEDD